MKSLLVLAISTLSVLGSAQVGPIQQFLSGAQIPSIVPHDSLSFSADSGAAFVATATAVQNYLANGKIDTCIISEFGSVVGAYKGSLNGSETQLEGIDQSNGGLGIKERLVFMTDQSGKDSVVDYYENSSGSSFDLVFRLSFTYNSANEVDLITISAKIGTQYIPVGFQEFYYANNLLDSIFYTISQSQNGDGYLLHHYSPTVAGKLIKSQMYEDLDNDGEKDLAQEIYYRHNLQNQITAVVQLNADPNTLVLSLEGELRYDVHKNSSIGIKEKVSKTLSVFPNPATNFIVVNSQEEEFSHYEILNIIGEPVAQGSFTSRIDVSQFNAGVYILNLKGAKKPLSLKFKKL